MGHLMFAGLFVFFIALIVGKIYFSYVSASKRRMDDKVEISVEVGEESQLFA